MGKGVFAFSCDGFAREARFRLCERRFRPTKAFSILQATFSLDKRVYDTLCLQRRKRHHREKTWLAMTITPLPTTNLAGSQKRVYGTKSCLANSKTLLQSENVARKGRNAFTERKRKRENALMKLIRVLQTKTCFPSENVARKAENERKKF